jgi:hypothetical protein
MPTKLGELYNSFPIPNARIQYKRGNDDVARTLALGNILSGNGTPMQISVTPQYDCFWVVRANIMLYGTSGGWLRSDWCLDISPADADGLTRTAQVITENVPGVGWRSTHGSGVFRLTGGTSYTCTMVCPYIQADAPQYHAGYYWIRIMGRTVGEGVA